MFPCNPDEADSRLNPFRPANPVVLFPFSSRRWNGESSSYILYVHRRAVLTARTGWLLFLAEARRKMASTAFKADDLTPREQEVLTLIAAGQSTKELAFSLGIRFKTAACHRTHVLEKLHARNTAHAIGNATVLGLLEFPATQTPRAPGALAEGRDPQPVAIPSWPGLEDIRAASRRLIESLNRARSLHAKLCESYCDLRYVVNESRFIRASVDGMRGRRGCTS